MVTTHYEIKTNDQPVASQPTVEDMKAWARGRCSIEMAQADSGQMNFSWRRVEEAYEVLLIGPGGSTELVGQYESRAEAVSVAKDLCDRIADPSGALSIAWRKVSVVTGPDAL